MNILYLINYAGKAGTEKYVLNLMHILSAQGETCHLAYNVPGQLSETVSSEGFACFRFEMSAVGDEIGRRDAERRPPPKNNRNSGMVSHL